MRTGIVAYDMAHQAQGAQHTALFQQKAAPAAETACLFEQLPRLCCITLVQRHQAELVKGMRSFSLLAALITELQSMLQGCPGSIPVPLLKVHGTKSNIRFDLTISPPSCMHNLQCLLMVLSGLRMLPLLHAHLPQTR